jgi:hypothetical protein
MYIRANCHHVSGGFITLLLCALASFAITETLEFLDLSSCVRAMPPCCKCAIVQKCWAPHRRTQHNGFYVFCSRQNWMAPYHMLMIGFESFYTLLVRCALLTTCQSLDSSID